MTVFPVPTFLVSKVAPVNAQATESGGITPTGVQVATAIVEASYTFEFALMLPVIFRGLMTPEFASTRVNA